MKTYISCIYRCRSVFPFFSTTMVNSRLTNITSLNATNPLTFKGETQDVHATIFWIIPCIIINGITCPFTFILNVLVIAAVKRRPRLQSNANIMLACLAVTDVLTGLTAQPLYAIWMTLETLGISNCALYLVYELFFTTLAPCSFLHLTLVVLERLVAIKFPFRYHLIVTMRNIKLAVPFCWVYGILYCMVLQFGDNKFMMYYIWVALPFVSCFVFIIVSYLVLYFETRRHQRRIKTQQLPREDVERYVTDNRALKTTVFVVGSVSLCLVPMCFYYLLRAFGVHLVKESNRAMLRTFLMLNSFLNPLIYCWRQKEMRQYLFKCSTQVVHPVD